MRSLKLVEETGKSTIITFRVFSRTNIGREEEEVWELGRESRHGDDDDESTTTIRVYPAHLLCQT